MAEKTHIVAFKHPTESIDQNLHMYVEKPKKPLTAEMKMVKVSTA